ncbi:DUF2849 domain-containing protein [Sphingosinicella sp. CPCC 101087]|uniref:DUF2849 domain-containing protein n=1 Tax=Sphingosinicella sp. CPCC 101087 TaxID=2497754 RepID=UPI00101D2E9A|nr:DUF2849 domain-containing protein [Sphingosinicella sp. CPCC 101087]
MAAGKRAALPLVLTASDLLDGDVVFYAGAGWARGLDEAAVAADEAQAAQFEAILAETEAKGDPVAPYLMTVRIDADGALVPGHVRERIRSRGPTIRTDLGPQARQERQHVSV